MKKQHVQGLMAAPFTPMNRNGSLNLAIVPQYYKMLKTNGVNGAFICGSTGEGVSLTLKEKKAVTDAWASAADSDFKVMLFLGGTCLEDCKELALYAKQSGLFAISFTAPFYFKPDSAETLSEMCAEVAAVVPDMPFYYYHIPVLTGVRLSMFDLLHEAEGRIDNFAGIKYTHEDFMDFLSCANFKNGKYDMLWGRDECMLAALSLGTKGVVGSTYNYAPLIYNEMIKAFNAGDIQKANDWQQKSIDMIRLLGKYGGIASGKSFMKLIGLDCGEFRLPIKNMSAEQFDLFKKDAEQIDFHSFASKHYD
ncbi:MAG: dihydrodipicolinate synthetase [Candidatus Nephrothrix sp. EaCA]|nr:MAG: dihydrodipicolinate synthetase [Candidatus Nephrothrix sp. EaCA]